MEMSPHEKGEPMIDIAINLTFNDILNINFFFRFNLMASEGSMTRR